VNSTELTRKDRLCFNVGKMQMKYGKNHFDFLPETYILPDEFSEFYKAFMLKQKETSDKNTWIVKPASSS
jgi:tubulin polyglutamylase TTLL5